MGKILFGKGSVNSVSQEAVKLPILEKSVLVETKIVEIPVEIEKIREVRIETIVEKLDETKLVELQEKVDDLSIKFNGLRKSVQESLRSVEEEIEAFDLISQSQEEMIDRTIKSVEDLHELEKIRQEQLDLDIEKFKESMKQLNARISTQNVLMSGSAIILLISILIFIVNQ